MVDVAPRRVVGGQLGDVGEAGPAATAGRGGGGAAGRPAQHRGRPTRAAGRFSGIVSRFSTTTRSTPASASVDLAVGRGRGGVDGQARDAAGRPRAVAGHRRDRRSRRSGSASIHRRATTDTPSVRAEAEGDEGAGGHRHRRQLDGGTRDGRRPATAPRPVAMLEAHWRPRGLHRARTPTCTRGSGCGTRASTPSSGPTSASDRAVVELGNVFAGQDPTRLRAPHRLPRPIPTCTPSSGGGPGTSSHHPAARCTATRSPSWSRRGVPSPSELVDRAAAGSGSCWTVAAASAGGLVELVHPWESGCDDSPRWDDLSAGRTVSADVAGGGRASWWRSIERATPAAPPSPTTSSRSVRRSFGALVAFNAVELATVTGDDCVARRRRPSWPRPSPAAWDRRPRHLGRRRTDRPAGPGSGAHARGAARRSGRPRGDQVDGGAAARSSIRRPSARRSAPPASTAPSRSSTRRPTGGARRGRSSRYLLWVARPHGPARRRSPTSWPTRSRGGHSVGAGRVLAPRHGRRRGRGPAVVDGARLGGGGG